LVVGAGAMVLVVVLEHLAGPVGAVVGQVAVVELRQ
jgi:hypothetical protein